MERLIKFDKFRNLGLEEPEYLVLNSNFEKGKIGNLLVIIGSNNSGKSNVLDGIVKISDGKVEQRDITTLSYEEKDRKPSVSLCYRDKESDFDVEYVSNIEEKGWTIKKSNIIEKKEITIAKNTVIQDLNNIVQVFSYYRPGSRSRMTVKNLISKIYNDPEFKYSTYESEIRTVVEEIKNNFNSNNGSSIWEKIEQQNLETVRSCLNENANEMISKEVSKIIGVRSIPSIYKYQETMLESNDLFVNDINNISDSRFFKSLFKAINIDASTILNAYKQFNENNNSAILNKLKKQMKSKVDKLNDQFNKMYFASNDQYKFTLDFESSRISFGMARGKDEDAITLEYQSTGFRWFFDLFFNFLTINELQPGDIVIMDEPATNLHPQGQAELRRFIKEYAVKNDVLFIIATHSPFLIDTDNYDELRVVSMENNRSSIDNTFTAVNLSDPDSLLPIKESLTIKQNVLYDLDTEVFWVEGITDYIYLTMFKNFFGIKNISFLPFNGVGKNKEQTRSILKRLLEIKFHKRSMLVDADKAGMDMYDQAKDSAFDTVHNLSEVELENGKNAMMIEDLFSTEDKKKYNVIKEKRSLGASELKIHAKVSDFADETVTNFKKLFDILQD